MKKIIVFLAVFLFACDNVFSKDVSYNNILPKPVFVSSKKNKSLVIDRNTVITDSDVGRVVVTRPNVTVTFKAPYTYNALTNIQKIKSINVKSANAVLVFKGGDYFIENITSENNGLFEIKTPNNSRLFVKRVYIKKGEVFLNKNGEPNKLLIYSDKFELNAKRVRGSFYLYGYGDVIIKAKGLIKGAVHVGGKGNITVDIKYIKPENMYKILVCNSLPPMSDKKENDKTLLGIDSNNNGIRDDVEIRLLNFRPRICYFKPNSKHCKLTENPAFLAVGLQFAKAYQTILKEFDGSEKSAYSLTKITDRAVDCDSYFTIDNRFWYENLLKLTEVWVFNTKERKKFYYEYNKQLSGGIFPIGKKSDDIKGCDFNVTLIEREIK
jgi:hypothetical protein